MNLDALVWTILMTINDRPASVFGQYASRSECETVAALLQADGPQSATLSCVFITPANDVPEGT